MFRRSLASEEEAIVVIYGGLLNKLKIYRNITPDYLGPQSLAMALDNY